MYSMLVSGISSTIYETHFLSIEIQKRPGSDGNYKIMTQPFLYVCVYKNDNKNQ